MTETRPVYLWRDHLRHWHALDPETYDLAELLVLHDAAHRATHSAPHMHGACPRCAPIGILMPRRLRRDVMEPVPAGCDTCDAVHHHPLCHPPATCRCGIDLPDNPTTEGTRPT